MDAYETGSYVWFEHPEETWTPAQVLSGASAAVRVAVVGSGEEFTFADTSGKFMRMNKQNLSPAPDMVKLGDLHEAALLHNLRLRFTTDDIFTYIGPILVACNPYKRLPIFTPEMIHRYHTASAAETLPPHVYGLANNTYANMLRDGEDQSVVISGESGAGKTEETKLCLEFLAAVASDERAGARPEQLLLKSSPILEAMGNAKTIRNNNSSRFGKYMQIRFNRNGKIMGGSIIKYLLEKARVVRPAPGERNYHIFYLMNFLTKQERSALKYTKPEKFRFCSGGGVTTVDGIDDENEMTEFREAWNMMGVSKDEVESLFRVVAAVLHLGNLSFGTDGEGHANVKNKVSGPLSTVAALFESELDELERTLTVRSMQSGGRNSEVVHIPLTPEQATESQEGLAKAAYSRAFDWVVSRLNQAVECPAGELTRNTIGVLDIFGFEIFEENSFEQLCINLANEKLQGHFNNHIFKLEMQVYATEGLDLTKISFVDNQPIIDLIEKKPSGLFPMIDDECVVPKGDDASLLGKLHDLHRKNRYWIKPPRAKSRDDEHKLPFVVQHYAGRVVYSATGFLSKNRDLLHPDLEGYMSSSASSFVRALFPPSEGHSKRGRAPTLGGQFRASLQELYEKLTSTAPHFIKCVKTNELKQANTFDSKYCLQQVEYLGLLEVVRIRRQGYPVRRTPENFVRRYALLAEDCPREAGALLHSVGTDGLWQLGKTMVFMKDEQLALLEAARAVCLDRSVRVLQHVLADFIKLTTWRKVAEGFKLLTPVVRGAHARALVPKMRTVISLTDNLQDAMSKMTPRFPPSPDSTALASALDAAKGAPSSHGLSRVPGCDDLVQLCGKGAALQERVSVEAAMLSKLQTALDDDDEDTCVEILDEAAQMIPPLTADPSQADSLLNHAAEYVRERAEARQLAVARENAAEILENLSRVLAIDVEAVATPPKPPAPDETTVQDPFPLATAMRNKQVALQRAASQARESGAGADPRVAECEAMAHGLSETLAALQQVYDAVTSREKEELVAAVENVQGHDLGPAGFEATQVAKKELLEIDLTGQLHELEKEQQALRGIGATSVDQKALERRIDATIAQAARAGITLERGSRPGLQVQKQRKLHPMLSQAALADEPYMLHLERTSAHFADLKTFPRWAGSEFSFRAMDLSKPLTSIPAVRSPGQQEELERKAINAFTLLLGWCGAVWHPQPAQPGATLLSLCATEPHLRDELYMQLLMQSGVDNPDAFIARRCWQLLALYMKSSLPPSPELRPYLQAFLFRTIRGIMQQSMTHDSEKLMQRKSQADRAGLPGVPLSGGDATIIGIAQRCLAMLARNPVGDAEHSLRSASNEASLLPQAATAAQVSLDAAGLEDRFTDIDEALRDQWVHVHLPDGTRRSFAIDDETTVCELLLTISVSLRIVQIDTFALYEVGGCADARSSTCGTGSGFASLEGNGTLPAVALDPRINVASQLRDWHRGNASANVSSLATTTAEFQSAGYGRSLRRLVLGKRLHVERTTDVTAAAAQDLVQLHLLYSQALGCVIRGKYTPEEPGDAVDLAALSIQAERGDYDPKIHKSDFLRSELAKHIAPTQLGMRKQSGWEISLLTAYGKLSGLSAPQAKEEYVKRCMACCRGYGVTFFRAAQSHRSNGAKTVLLGVSVEGVTVRELTAFDVVVEHYRLQKLKSWGVGTNGAVYFKMFPDPGYHELESSGDEGVSFLLDNTATNNSPRELCSLLQEYALWLAARRKREQVRGQRRS